MRSTSARRLALCRRVRVVKAPGSIDVTTFVRDALIAAIVPWPLPAGVNPQNVRALPLRLPYADSMETVLVDVARLRAA